MGSAGSSDGVNHLLLFVGFLGHQIIRNDFRLSWITENTEPLVNQSKWNIQLNWIEWMVQCLRLVYSQRWRCIWCGLRPMSWWRRLRRRRCRWQRSSPVSVNEHCPQFWSSVEELNQSPRHPSTWIHSRLIISICTNWSDAFTIWRWVRVIRSISSTKRPFCPLQCWYFLSIGFPI